MRILAAAFCLCWLAASPLFAQRDAADDPLVGGERLSQWKQRLADNEVNVRMRAEDRLAELGPAAIDSILRILADENRQVRDGAAWALARIGPPAVPALIEALGGGSEWQVREGAPGPSLPCPR